MNSQADWPDPTSLREPLGDPSVEPTSPNLQGVPTAINTQWPTDAGMNGIEDVQDSQADTYERLSRYFGVLCVDKTVMRFCKLSCKPTTSSLSHPSYPSHPTIACLVKVL